MPEGFNADKSRFEGIIQTCDDEIRDIDLKIRIGVNQISLIAPYPALENLTRTMAEILIDHIEIGKMNKENGVVPVSIFWNF